MIGVYTYWTKPDKAAGFLSVDDLMSTLALSIGFARRQKHIERIDIVTDSKGKELLELYDIDFDVIRTDLDDIENVAEKLWAYPKIYSISLYNEPFIHMDLDLGLIDQMTDKMINADFTFQCAESATLPLYQEVLKETADFLPQIIDDNRSDNAWNCGIIMCNDIETKKIWTSTVNEHLFGARTAEFMRSTDLYVQNHLSEQYFIGCLTKGKNVQVLLPNFNFNDRKRMKNPEFKFFHLWSGSKKRQYIIDGINRMLEKEFPETYRRVVIDSPVRKFSEVYKKELWGKGKTSGSGSDAENNKPYREYLQKLLDELEPETVTDLGCGYWDSNALIDWKEIRYTGIDVVESVLDSNRRECNNENCSFILGNEKKLPGGDLLILKDVMIHWSNERISEFLSNVKGYKNILITNDVTEDVRVNQDIVSGQFRAVDIEKDPFNIIAESSFDWEYTNKQGTVKKRTWLINGVS